MVAAVDRHLVAHVVNAAREAGRVIRERHDSRSRPDWKVDGSPLTDADRASHEAIVAWLRRADPETAIVSEEAEIPPASERTGWRRFWLIDPLDGTREFVDGLPDYTVNIALIVDGVPILGVVHAPARDVLYYGGRGHGSWRQDGDAAPVRIYSRPPAPGTPLRLLESRSHRSAELDAFAGTWPVCERVAVGSSLKFCWLAEGRADVYARFTPLHEWDVAAGDAVFRWSSPSGEPRYSPLQYNTADLIVPRFVIGFTPPPPAVVWFTGLSGSGKTTVARMVAERLTQMGAPVELLDGDEIRAVFPTVGFSRADRDAHIRRVGHAAALLEKHGLTSLVSLVSPYRESREFVRGLCRRFIEVYVSTPIDECERRDAKGLYGRARRGEVPQFTGVSDPYEPPAAPELVIDTRAMAPDQAADKVMDVLMERVAVNT
jgi:3'(2'), 5'-bisphosphate nucleotidase